MKKDKKIIIISVIIILSGILLFFMPTNMETDEKQIQGEAIKLPDPVYTSDTSVEQALLKRKSVREYQNLPIRLTDISQLLWAAQGITREDGKRTAPSAGALYPLEVYVVAGKVDHLDAGIYKYKPYGHKLIKIADGDVRDELSDVALGQASIGDGAAIIAIAGVYGRTKVKYAERAERYVHMEAGHAAQNIYLQAVSLKLGTVVTGAFFDNQVKTILKLDKEEEPLYLMPIGRP